MGESSSFSCGVGHGCGDIGGCGGPDIVAQNQGHGIFEGDGAGAAENDCKGCGGAGRLEQHGHDGPCQQEENRAPEAIVVELSELSFDGGLCHQLAGCFA